MARKGENIYKRKDGRWEGRYIKARSENGKAIYGYVYASSYNDVRKKRHLAINNVKSTLPVKHPKANTANQDSFSQLSNNWLSSIRSQIKESTYTKYNNILQSYLLPEFADTSINSVTSSQIQKFCDGLLTHGGTSGEGLSPKTVADILSLIRSILRYAQIQGYRPPCTGKEVQIRQTTPDTVIIPLPAQEILCRYLYSHMSERSLGVLLCLFTGMRIGELCALKWEDFSFREKAIYVHRTMQRLQIQGTGNQKTMVIVTTPKSKCSIRTIPIPESLLQLICREFPDCKGYVLAAMDEEYVEPRTMQNYFKYVQEECCLTPVNFHALGHTFATRCIELGFDVKSLSEILGHASINITMNRYVHPSMELKQQNMQKLSGLLAVM